MDFFSKLINRPMSLVLNDTTVMGEGGGTGGVTLDNNNQNDLIKMDSVDDGIVYNNNNINNNCKSSSMIEELLVKINDNLSTQEEVR